MARLWKTLLGSRRWCWSNLLSSLLCLRFYWQRCQHECFDWNQRHPTLFTSAPLKNPQQCRARLPPLSFSARFKAVAQSRKLTSVSSWHPLGLNSAWYNVPVFLAIFAVFVLFHTWTCFALPVLCVLRALRLCGRSHNVIRTNTVLKNLIFVGRLAVVWYLEPKLQWGANKEWCTPSPSQLSAANQNLVTFFRPVHQARFVAL